MRLKLNIINKSKEQEPINYKKILYVVPKDQSEHKIKDLIQQVVKKYNLSKKLPKWKVLFQDYELDNEFIVNQCCNDLDVITLKYCKVGNENNVKEEKEGIVKAKNTSKRGLIEEEKQTDKKKKVNKKENIKNIEEANKKSEGVTIKDTPTTTENDTRKLTATQKRNLRRKKQLLYAVKNELMEENKDDNSIQVIDEILNLNNSLHKQEKLKQNSDRDNKTNFVTSKKDVKANENGTEINSDNLNDVSINSKAFFHTLKNKGDNKNKENDNIKKIINYRVTRKDVEANESGIEINNDNLNDNLNDISINSEAFFHTLKKKGDNKDYNESILDQSFISENYQKHEENQLKKVTKIKNQKKNIRTEEDYQKMQMLDVNIILPDSNQKMAFKIYELTKDYGIGISDFKEAIITNYNSNTEEISYKLINQQEEINEVDEEGNLILGKFELKENPMIQNENGATVEYITESEKDTITTVPFSSLIDVRLLE
ncbi:hypothetical protein K502DRAFT_326230 [Neoconidiobolus thromboides FSU 785]|nr:hypothetical protein K502DRAFT_326230 [Neoconidiobolus thromboides FSU 785]